MSENVEPVEIPGVYFNHLSVGVQEAAGLATVHVVKEKGGFASATVRIADLLSALGYEDTTEAQPREPRVGDRVRIGVVEATWPAARQWEGASGVVEDILAQPNPFPYRVAFGDEDNFFARGELTVLP